MQLPRGTFRSIQKGVRFSDILADLVSTRFTGMCTISSASLNGTLVFRSGVCVLAKIQDHYSDQGWAVLMENPDLTVDLAISDFNTAQIQLALDFNKKALVHLSATPPSQKSVPQEQPARTGERVSREPVKHAAHSRREQKKHEVSKPPVTPAEVVMAAAPVLEEPVKQDVAGDEPIAVAKTTSVKTPGSPEELDLEMFDTMDLDDVALKIRKDCKIILKQLQLDHLTEK